MAETVRISAFTLPLAGPDSTNPAAVRNFLPWLQGYLDQIAPEFRNGVRLNFTCVSGTPTVELFYNRDITEAQTEEEWERQKLIKEIAELDARIAQLQAKRDAKAIKLGGSPLGG